MSPQSHVNIALAGESVALLAARALFWPRQAVLFIADPHFGKPDSFQAAGIPIPDGSTGADLARLSACLRATGAQQLVILGDFFHSRHSQSAAVLAALASWRTQHPALAITLIEGNHDRHAGPPPAELAIETVAEPRCIGPFACHHHPPDEPTSVGSYVLAGHLHPVAVLRDVDGTGHRFPCFHAGAGTMILPAFGTFTGGQAIRPRSGERVFVVHDRQIHEVTPGLRAATA